MKKSFKEYFKELSDFKTKINLCKLYEKYPLYTWVGYFLFLSVFSYVVYSYHLFNPSFFPEFNWDYYIKDASNIFFIIGVTLLFGGFCLKVYASILIFPFEDLARRKLDKKRSSTNSKRKRKN